MVSILVHAADVKSHQGEKVLRAGLCAGFVAVRILLLLRCMNAFLRGFESVDTFIKRCVRTCKSCGFVMTINHEGWACCLVCLAESRWSSVRGSGCADLYVSRSGDVYQPKGGNF